MVEIDWLAVAVGTIGYQVLGAVWYGPAFGSIWMAAMGYGSAEEMAVEDPRRGYVVTAIGSLVVTVALAVLVDWTGATTWGMGLAVGALAGVGFVATAGLQEVAFEGRPRLVYVLHVGYNGLALAGIGVLLAVW